MPLDEYVSEYKELMGTLSLYTTFLISPTTSEDRIRKIDETSKGFIYAVSSSSTTGVKGDFSKEQEEYFKKLQAMQLKNPFLIGFGVSSHQTFSKACQYGSGAIIGSAFINLLKESNDIPGDIETFVKSIRNSNLQPPTSNFQ